jgi:3-oxoacyl-[acyl-carrier-protein] synthase III
MPIGGTRRPPSVEMFSAAQDTENVAGEFMLELPIVEETALTALPAAARAVLAQAGRQIHEVDHCFLQPITPITDDRIRRELGLPHDRFHSLIGEFGRGGSGGVALAMLARAATTLARGRSTSLVTAIGAGLAWGSALLETDGVVCAEPVEM